jgi:hypothetical protein
VTVSDWPEQNAVIKTLESNNSMNTAVDGFFPRVSLGFARKIDTDLIAFTRNIVEMMTTNPQYPTPSPTLATITTSVDALEVAVMESLDGGKLQIARRNAARVELLSLVRQLAAYVTGHCSGDLVNLLSSGFTAVRAPSPAGQLPPPQNQRLVNTGMSGQLTFRFDRVVNAANYSIESAISGDGPWQDRGLWPNTRVTLDGLTPGKMYWARARANGTAGPSEWGGPGNAMAT